MTLLLTLRAKQLSIPVCFIALALSLVFGQCHATNTASDDEIERLIEQSIEALYADKPITALQLCKKVIELRPEIADGYYCSGLAFRSLKMYDEALASLQQAAKLEPTEPMVYFWQGFIYYELGQFEKAVPLLQKTLELKPDDAPTYTQLGFAYLKMGRPEEAKTACQKAIGLKPDWISYLCLCEADFFDKKYTEALKHCELSISLNDGDNRAHAHLAYIYFSLGQVEKSFKASKVALQHKPDHFQSLFINGSSLSKLGEHEAAVEILQRAAQIKPDPAIYSALGNAYGYIGKLQEKKEAFKKVIELDPNNADAYVMLGMTCIDLKEYDKALVSLQQAAKLERTEPMVYFWQGFIYYELGQFEKAVPLLQKTLELKPDHAEAYSYLGMAYTQLNHLDEARTACQRAVALKPNWFSYLCLCEADTFSKDFAKAVMSCENSVKLHSNQYRGHSVLGLSYFMLDLNEKAEESFKKALQYQPDSYTDLCLLGTVLGKLAKYEESVEILLKAVDIKSDDPAVYSTLGTSYGYLGKYREKVEAFWKVIRLDPNNEGAYVSLALTYLELKEYDKTIEICMEGLNHGFNRTDLYELLASAYFCKKDYENAIDAYSKIVKLSPNESKSYVNLGQTLYFARKYKEGTAALLSAHEKNPNNERVLYLLGSGYDMMGEREKANEIYSKLIKIKPNDEIGYMNLAQAYAQLKNYEEAIDAYSKALSYNQKNFYAHAFLGDLYMTMKDYEKAITSFEFAKQLGKNDDYIYNDLSSAYLALKRYDKSIEVLKEAIQLRPDNYETYFTLADVYAQANSWDNAKEALKKGLEKKPDAINDLGIICMKWANLGRLQDCAKPLQNILETCRKNNNLLCEGDATLGIGLLGLLNSEEMTAEVNYNKALKIFEKLGATDRQAGVMGLLIYLYSWLSKPEKVHEALKLRLALAKQLNNPVLMVEILNQLAFTAEADDEKKSYALQAINLAKENNMDESYAVYESYWVMAISSYKNKDYIAMWQYGDKLDKIAENSEYLLFKARHEVEMGNGLNAIGEHEKALVRFRKGYEIASQIDYPRWKAGALCGLGDTSAQMGNAPEAINYYKQCADSWEELRTKIQSPELKLSFSKNMDMGYEFLVTLMVTSGDTEQAFSYVERSKARALLEILGNTFSPRLSAKNRILRIRSLQGTMMALEEKLQKFKKGGEVGDKLKFRAIEREFETIKTEYTSLLDEIKRENPEEHSLLSVSTLTLREVMDLLESDETLLEYFVTPFNKTFVWIIDKSEFKLVEIPIGSGELEARVNRYREKIASFDPEYQNEAEALYELLLEPAMQHVKNKRIVIVPHASLNHLPFHALMTSKNADSQRKGRFLIEDFDVFYAPSASVLRFIYEKRKPLSGKILAFGNPSLDEEDLELPYAEEEVKRIKSVYPETTVFLSKQATKTRVQNLASSYNAIHFATHAEMNADSPMSSNIRLAKDANSDGTLKVHEIFGLDLINTSMVALSGCETALGKRTGGDEIVGLSRAFIYAGAPTIIASLWKVNDQSTAELMTLFYKNLRTLPKAKALRKAQIEMIRGPAGKGIVRGVGGITTAKKVKTIAVKEPERTVDGSHPYFWAPFVLIGDWK